MSKISIKNKGISIVIVAGFFLASVAVAGNVKNHTRSVPVYPRLDTVLAKYKLQLKELEESEISVKQFFIKQKQIIQAFKNEREIAYANLKVTENVECHVSASRPSIFKGRNTDNCSVTLPMDGKRSWLYDVHSTSELGRLSGGYARYNVAVSAAKDTVTLKTHCRSPHWHDTSSGHCALGMKLSVTFKMTDAAIKSIIDGEAVKLIIE